MIKNAINILSTIVFVGLYYYHMYTVYIAYDGGVVGTWGPFMVGVPIVVGVDLWRILRSKIDVETKPKQTLGQKIFLVIFVIVGCVFAIYLMITSHFYSLTGIVLGLIIVVMIPACCLENRLRYKLVENQVALWSYSVIGFYLAIFMTVFIYLQVVQPVTVEQAIEIVEEEYGVDNYVFVSYVDRRGDGDTPLGIYWFAQQQNELDGWIEVDLITGSINELFE